jgi:integration host factor subunit beta
MSIPHGPHFFIYHSIDNHHVTFYDVDLIDIKGGIMNKADLVNALKNQNGFSRYEAEKIVDIFFGSMAESLAKGERVEIRGFGSIFVKDYKAYVGRNPKTGDPVRVKPKRLPFFRCGKELKERVDLS